MADIFINDNLRLNRSGLQVKDSNDSWIDLHCQQGRLDGACVVYSVVMALLSIGYINSEDIDVNKDPNPDKRTDKGKLLSRLLDEKGLIRDGYYVRTMAKILRTFCPDLIITTHRKEDIIVPAIRECAMNNIPVVLIVQNDDMSHAVFVVGFEYNGDKTSKILCVDPGVRNETTAYWNCIIDVSRKANGNYPFWYITSEIKSKIELQEIITIKEDKD